MALDLSPERHGSKAPEEPYMSYDEIMEDADRIAETKKFAKIISQEIIKELDKREESIEDTAPVTETVQIAEVQMAEPVAYANPLAAAGGGFFVGVLISSMFFMAKIRQIRRENETWR